MKLRTPKFSLVEQEEKRQDLGFGKQITDASTRLVNPDGTFNVRKVNVPFWGWLNLYHRLITMPWSSFLGLVLGIFVFVNFIFAGLYSFIGLEHLVGINVESEMSGFWDAFFFSAQTLTTVGYGRIAPVGFWASLLAAVESLMGLLAFALATGLMYGRFSRPTARVAFSEKALIAPYLDTTALMFRMVNVRSNQLIEISAEMSLSRIEQLSDGRLTRKYYGLPLERSKVNFFPLNWTIVHPITPESPLWGVSEEEFMRSDSELLIYVRATEDTFSNLVHARTSYNSGDILWGAKFKKMYDTSTPGTTTLDISKLSDYEEAQLPVLQLEQ